MTPTCCFPPGQNQSVLNAVTVLVFEAWLSDHCLTSVAGRSLFGRCSLKRLSIAAKPLLNDSVLPLNSSSLPSPRDGLFSAVTLCMFSNCLILEPRDPIISPTRDGSNRMASGRPLHTLCLHRSNCHCDTTMCLLLTTVSVA